MPIKNRVRGTPPTLVGDAQVEDQGHRPCRIRKVCGEIYVSTLLTPAPDHLLCLYFVGCAKQVSNLLTVTAQSWAFFSGSRMGGICAPTVRAKKVSQRLAEQASLESLR